MPIPPPKVMLTISDYKRQLIGFIVDDLCSNTVLPEISNIRRLVVTGEDPVPVELTSTITIRKEDLRTIHEEADNKLAHQMVVVASEETRVYLSYPTTQMYLFSCYIIMLSRSLLG